MTRLRCGGIVKSYNNCKFTAESVGVRNSENRLTFGEVVDKSSVSCFLTHGVYCFRINYPRRARSALGVDTVLTLDVCLYVCMFVCMLVL